MNLSLSVRLDPPRYVVQDNQGRIVKVVYLSAMPIDRCRRLVDRFLRQYNQKEQDNDSRNQT